MEEEWTDNRRQRQEREVEEREMPIEMLEGGGMEETKTVRFAF